MDAATGAPIRNARVVAFTDFANGIGAQGYTDNRGQAALVFPGGAPILQRVYVFASASPYWSAYRENIVPGAAFQVGLTPVDLAFVDSVRHFYPHASFDREVGVTVGVVDTGIAAHPDLNLVGGVNTVTGENSADYDDPDGHGTHVAGLVGAGGVPPMGIRGVAAGVALRAYRVFGAGSDAATNYAITKALIVAGLERCDVANLSLGGRTADSVTREAITNARDNGMLVICAAGNDGRQSVSYPAAYPDSIAVSAMGRLGTFPVGALEESHVATPTGTANDDFVASFTNVGYEIDLTAPGVGALSTVPGPSHAPMSGTSMAAPVVAGAAATVLSREPGVYDMPRTRARSDALMTALYASATPVGLGLVYEGMGMPRL